MENRKFFGDNTLISDFVQKLNKVETLDGGWSTKYLENETGFYWLKYIADDRSSSMNLMLISPPPTTDDIIDLVFISNYSDEVSAAANRLCIEEKVDKTDFRHKLISRIDIDLTKLDHEERDRIKNIIQSSQLTDKVNRRVIVGKHYIEIEKDAEYFSSIAKRAETILNSLI